MSIWTEVCEECFQHLVKRSACHPELRKLWRQKRVRPFTGKVAPIKWTVSAYRAVVGSDSLAALRQYFLSNYDRTKGPLLLSPLSLTALLKEISPSLREIREEQTEASTWWVWRIYSGFQTSSATKSRLKRFSIYHYSVSSCDLVWAVWRFATISEQVLISPCYIQLMSSK